MRSLRIVFAGTPSVAVPSLSRLVGLRHDVVAVITREDAPIGRKRLLTPSPVAVAAAAHGLPIIRANRLTDDVTERVAELAPDLGVIVAYGGLVREPLLSTPQLGWINLHFSLLPRWRGAAPVQHAVIAGDRVTGAAVFQLAAKLDAGDVYDEVQRPIGADETAGEVLEGLAESGSELLASVIDGIAAGTSSAAPQHGEPTTAPKLSIDDARIRWDRPAGEVYARLRGVSPEPGAFTEVEGMRLKILAARRAETRKPLPPGVVSADGRSVLVGTATDPIELVRVQPAGRTAMDAAAWWRGMARSEAVAR